MKVNINRASTAPQIKTLGSTAPRIDPATLARELGATAVTTLPAQPQSPISLMALRQEMFARLHSSGGRPGLSGATRRQKIPLPDADWHQLEQLSGALRETDLLASPGQVASALLHTSLRWVRTDRSLDGSTEYVDVDPNSVADCPPRILLEVA